MRTQAKLKILVVDDDPNMHRLITLYLKDAKADVVSASSARMALHQMTKQGFHLIISDMQMPQMDGIELVKRIRSAGSKIPVLIVSAFGASTHASAALQAGADVVLEKPFEQDELLRIIKQLIQKR